MTQDPLDALQSFYDECQMAPIPESLSHPPKGPWWLRLAIPLAGLGFGSALAVAIVASPMPASQQAGMATAEAIAYRSLAIIPDAPANRTERIDHTWLRVPLHEIYAFRTGGPKWTV